MSSPFIRASKPSGSGGFLSDLMAHIRSFFPHPNAVSGGGSGGGGSDVSLAQVSQLISNHNSDNSAHVGGSLIQYATKTELAGHANAEYPHYGVLAQKNHLHSIADVEGLEDALANAANSGGSEGSGESSSGSSSGKTKLKKFYSDKAWNSLTTEGSYYIESNGGSTLTGDTSGLYPCFADVKCVKVSAESVVKQIQVTVTPGTADATGAEKVSGTYYLDNGCSGLSGDGNLYFKQGHDADGAIYYLRFIIRSGEPGISNRWAIVRETDDGEGNIDQTVIFHCTATGLEDSTVPPPDNAEWTYNLEKYQAIGGNVLDSIAFASMNGDTPAADVVVMQSYTYFNSETEVLKRERFLTGRLQYDSTDGWVLKSNATPHWNVLHDYR